MSGSQVQPLSPNPNSISLRISPSSSSLSSAARQRYLPATTTPSHIATRKPTKYGVLEQAKSLAEEEANKSQELTKEAAKKSQELTSSIVANARLSDIVSEIAKRSKELAVEASNQIKSLSFVDNFADLNKMKDLKNDKVSSEELHKFGVAEELNDFVQSITFDSFKDFPLPG
ncbi:hypothetical protein RND81_12G057500 [Saponaria officinalis]|uniref:Uncharacterized protein n=1 Tax=Saponaria officinalis TaxID=3572 RepID=A0AAW1H5N0_SAPOF